MSEVTPTYTKKPGLVITHENKIEIDITPDSASPTWKTFGAGFTSMSESLNETVQQYFFLNDGGYARNYVTGMAPTFEMSGVRVVGDDAQDYIFAPSRKYGLLDERNTNLRITHPTGENAQAIITIPITLCNMTSVSGETTDGSAVSVEMRFNGAPTIS